MHAVSMLRDAVDLTPDGHPVTNLLALIASVSPSELVSNASGTWVISSPQFSTLRDAVDLTPHGHPDKPARLSNFGSSFLNFVSGASGS
jgi:hypothetical protein